MTGYPKFLCELVPALQKPVNPVNAARTTCSPTRGQRCIKVPKAQACLRLHPSEFGREQLRY